MGRIMIFTGKGGVGKTTVAAAHARKAALQGKKTLIISTDMAHNLADLFEMPIGKEETKVAENLYALEVDPNYEMSEHYATIENAIRNMLPAGKVNEDDLEDIVLFPGIEELFSLIRIQEIDRANRYDLLVVDCAPTGETLSLLKFPELFSWVMEKFFPLGKGIVKVLRPVSKRIFQVELPNTEAMNDIERLYQKLYELQKMLKDRENCSIRLVTIPEKMVVEETKRNYMYMNLYNFNVDAVFINRILPKETNDSFFDEWVLVQQQYIRELEDVFGEMPIYRLKWYDTDMNGLSALDHIISDSLKDDHLCEVLRKTQSEVFEKTDSGYQLKVSLPFVKKDEFDLYANEEEVIIKVQNFKRNIPLPSVIANLSIAGAKLEDGILNIRFE